MAICGWCKASDVDTTKSNNGEPGGLVPHTVPTTVKTECKGYETYRDLGPDGKSSRAKG